MDICQQGLGPAPVEIGLLKYETDLQCIVSGPKGSHELSGRADYCVGYGGTEQQEANLAVIETKRPTEYGEARTQVLGSMSWYFV
ncbi:uncharacterized protein BJX67DRAFT_382731 [Aspergillus lucknowensis]|uniref:Uncharacterized protein n=1 Tax=Aspergillus lucknowensis TaxID=176173 RepID=A0ABR4LLT2_9EURO